jgi:hypothetical protein
MRTLLQLDDREQATIKAALECYAACPTRELYLETANDHGTVSALGLDETLALFARVGTTATLSAAIAIAAERQAAEEPELNVYGDAADQMHYVRDGEVEVDTQGKVPIVSKGEDAGAYVLGWIWVDDETAGVEADEEDEDDGE